LPDGVIAAAPVSGLARRAFHDRDIGEQDIGFPGDRHVRTLLAAKPMQPTPNRKIGNHRGHEVE